MLGRLGNTERHIIFEYELKKKRGIIKYYSKKMEELAFDYFRFLYF